MFVGTSMNNSITRTNRKSRVEPIDLEYITKIHRKF